MTREGVGEQNGKEGKKSSDLRVSTGSQTPPGSSMSPFRVPSPQISYHFLSSTLHPLTRYQQIPPVKLERPKEIGREMRVEEEEVRRVRSGFQSHIVGLREDL